MYPPASGTFLRTVPPGGDTIAGKFVPGGTSIGSSPLGIHRSKQTFGPDADLFRPERWLEAETDPERLALMNSTVDLVFHYGKYQCLGKNIAMMEFNKLFVELLRVFEFVAVRPEMPLRMKNGGIWIIEDFWVRVTRRVPDALLKL
jgi:cytochrome P450